MDSLMLLGVVLGLWLMMAAGMALAWAVEQRSGNAGWVDVTWTLAMGATGILAVLLSFDGRLRPVVVIALILLWALRLAVHIAERTAKIADDPRYAELRQQWGAAAPRRMLWLLQAQAALSVPMILSVVLAAWNPQPLFTPLGLAALVVYGIGLYGSALADRQLRAFRASGAPPGAICDRGLWAWSRHPNYFFEWLVWVAFALLAIDVTGAQPLGLLALIGPACMYWLLRHVSGVPPLEAHMLAKYGGVYAGYQRTTSVFFPLPPQRSSP